MNKKPLFTESTDVPVSKSIAEITRLLIDAGARQINSQYAPGGKITALAFVLPFGQMELPYMLPVRVDPVFKVINHRRTTSQQGTNAAKDREQAERVAWRQLYWWLKAQLALIQTGMVESAEVLLPYMQGPDGRSFFDTYRPRMLEAGKAAE